MFCTSVSFRNRLNLGQLYWLHKQAADSSLLLDFQIDSEYKYNSGTNDSKIISINTICKESDTSLKKCLIFLGPIAPPPTPRLSELKQLLNRCWVSTEDTPGERVTWREVGGAYRWNWVISDRSEHFYCFIYSDWFSWGSYLRTVGGQLSDSSLAHT